MKDRLSLSLVIFMTATQILQADPQRVEKLIVEAERLASPQVRKGNEAIPRFREAIHLAQQENNEKLQARGWVGLGSALMSVHDTAAAQKALMTGLVLSRKTGPLSLEVTALQHLAGIANERGEVQEQLRWIEQIADLGRSTGNVPARLRGLNSYASVTRRQGQTAAAIRYGREGLRELDRAIASGVAGLAIFQFQIPYNLSKSLADAGEYQEAIRLLDRARRAAETDRNIAGIWHVMQDLGEVHQILGDVESATNYYRQALEVARRIESRDPEAETLRALGSVAESHGDLETAIRYYSEAQAIFRRTRVEAELPETLVSLSRAKWRAGERDESKAILSNAIAVATEMENSFALVLARLEAGARSADPQHYVTALRIAQDNGLNTLVPAAWNGIAASSRRRGDIAAALHAYESAADAVDRIHARIPMSQQRLSFVATTHEIYRDWVDSLLDAGRPSDAFLVLERERSRNLLQALKDVADLEGRDDTTHPSDLKTLSLTELQSVLQPGELFVAYASAANHVTSFAVTARAIRVVKTNLPDAELKIAAFHDALRRSETQRALATGLVLSRSLLEPLNIDGSVRRLIVAPSGELAGLAFAALPQPGTRMPLVTAVEVTYTTSLRELTILRSRQRVVPRQDLLAVAPLKALPATQQEIDRVSALMRGSVHLLPGDAATEMRVKGQALSDYKVLHFASHAVLDSRFPFQSAIQLASGGSDDGRLEIREIYRLNLADQLVVLSACSTAYGRSSAAEGMQSLARAFTHAGARTVVGTLWQVEDRAAARLVEAMYARLVIGDMVSTAVRGAQLALIGGDPYSNAAIWAPWVASGDPGTHFLPPPAQRRGADGFAMAVVSTLLFVLILGFVMRGSRRSENVSYPVEVERG